MIKEQCVGFLNTPPLWTKNEFDVAQFGFPNLNIGDFQATSNPTNLRLGHQMEYVFKQLVEFSEDYDVVLHNLQIRQEKRTLGEIDFILKDKLRNKLIHVELTYKFYIIDPTITDPILSLIGPNRHDSFFKKIEKIKNVQFPLLHSNAGADSLLEKGLDHANIEHQCCFKAQLFQQYGSSEINIGALNKECLSGFWLRFDDLLNEAFTNALFYLPTKSEWVIKPNDLVEWKSISEIKETIQLLNSKENSPMLWVKYPNNTFEKLFVVWW